MSVDPVNVTESTSGCAARAAPTSRPGPVTTFTIPGGKPAAPASSPNFKAVSGVSVAGFSTTALPAARAGATPREARRSG